MRTIALVLILLSACLAVGTQQRVEAQPGPQAAIRAQETHAPVLSAGIKGLEAFAKTGTIKDLFPPGNNGTRHGAGQITEDETGKQYVFHTPEDVSPGSILFEGDAVTFEAGKGNQATGVTKTRP